MIKNDKTRFVKFDLVPLVKNNRKLPPKIEIPKTKIPREITKSSQNIPKKFQYVWDEVGKFWTYQKSDQYNYKNDLGDFPVFPNSPCQPPFCWPRNCDKSKCNLQNCIFSSKFCQFSSNECAEGQQSVKFRNKIVCVNKEEKENCQPNCGRNGICIKNKCYCQNGYQGETCLIMNAEICKEKHGLVCRNGCSTDENENKLKCVCGKGETRMDCLELRTCPNECKNGAVCVSGKCQCPEGYHGEGCELELNYCSPGQIGNKTCDHICISEGKNRFICKCREGFLLNNDGKTCDKKQCYQNGTKKLENGNCQCSQGWKGQFCDQDVDECKFGDICQHICHNTLGSFECQCMKGFTLLNNGICARNCMNNCSGRGDCLNGLCHCFTGWQGVDCSVDIDECQYNHGCEHQCMNIPGSFVCQCPPGQLLLPDKKHCDRLLCGGQCLNEGKCLENKCVCKKGFTGKRCESVNFCEIFSPCQQVCSMINDSITCSCKPGFTLQPDGRSCVKNCECIHGQCVDMVCHCKDGFQGVNCNEDIDECTLKSHDCHQICNNTVGSYMCSCFEGFVLMSDRKTCGRKQCPVCIRGKCVNNTCICPQGFYGEKCEQDINECKNLSLCDHFCSNTAGSYVCNCRTGYKLNKDKRKCDKILNSTCTVDCVRGECRHSRCICPTGFTGSKCELDIDECNFGSVCNQICENTIGGYKCSCYPGFNLSLDQINCVPYCPNCGKGFCQEGRCVCPSGFEGDRCQHDVNECENKIHLCDHHCINVEGGYNCSCQNGYVLNVDGRSCSINRCSSNCQNGICLNHICSCNPGFKGKNCEEDIDECSTGKHNCQSFCENIRGSFHCRCPENQILASDKKSCQFKPCKSCVHGLCLPNGKCSCDRGFYGTLCDQDIDECKTWDGVCQHVCINTLGAYKCLCQPGYILAQDGHSCKSLCSLCQNGLCDPINSQCQCKSGWTGELCNQDIDECKLKNHRCEHNCININGSYECSCQPSYYLSEFDGRTCIKEENNCSVSCKNGGRCISEKCECKAGYTGISCEKDINECLQFPPRHGCIGECRNTFGNYECICPPGYVQLDDQKTCKIASKDTMCNPPCQNGGVCRDMSRCYCPLGFQGSDCSLDIDECIRYSPCDQKHGTCKNTYGTYYCQCKEGYVLMFDGNACMKIEEAILRPHLRYRGRGTKGYIPPLEK